MRSRKTATDRLLAESQDLLAGVEEESDEVTARHEVEDLNGDGREKLASQSELKVAGPGGLKFELRGAGPTVVIVALLVVLAAGVGVFGHLHAWW